MDNGILIENLNSLISKASDSIPVNNYYKNFSLSAYYKRPRQVLQIFDEST